MSESNPNIIQFPDSPTVSRKRTSSKRANRQTSEVKAHMVSLGDHLSIWQKREAVAMWRRGVRMCWIAKAMGKKTEQVEGALWAVQHGFSDPDGGHLIVPDIQRAA